MGDLQQGASVHEETVQALARGELEPLPRSRLRRSTSRSSKVTEDRVCDELMAVVRRLAAESPAYRVVVESPTEVWLR